MYIHCRQLDKFKPAELCNFVWGVAQLSPQADVDLLQEVLQASPTWSEVSTHALAPSISVTLVLALALSKLITNSHWPSHFHFHLHSAN